MGIGDAVWQNAIFNTLIQRGLAVVKLADTRYHLIQIEGDKTLVVHLVSIVNDYVPDDLLQLQEGYRLQGIQLVQLWEDIWLTRPRQVIGRLSSMLGLNRKIHGRKTKIQLITQAVADEFFNRNHLQGSAKARYKYALTLDDRIVAMASFSAKRAMTRKAEGYTSIELILFATEEGYTVQGGLSKLIKHVAKTIAPNDVMTYADLDWSYGKGYEKLGFQLDEQTAAAEIFLDQQTMTRYFKHRLPVQMLSTLSSLPENEIVSHLNSSAYNRIFNTGNLKYILNL